MLRLRAEATKGTGSETSLGSHRGWASANARLFVVASRPVSGQMIRYCGASGVAAGHRGWRSSSGDFSSTLSIAGVATGIVTIVDDYDDGSEFLMLVSADCTRPSVCSCVSLFAPTVLAEERVRGSLDVLMTTPLSTDRIVLAKWWGAYRVVPALAILPAIGCLIIAAAALRSTTGRLGESGRCPHLSTAVDHIAYVASPWRCCSPRGPWSRASAWRWRPGSAGSAAPSPSALRFVRFFAFGWIILVEIAKPIAGVGFVPDRRSGGREFVILEVLATACPLGGQMSRLTTLSWPARTEPTRLLHRSSHRAAGDDRNRPGGARLDNGHVRSLRRPHAGTASSRTATTPPRSGPLLRTCGPPTYEFRVAAADQRDLDGQGDPWLAVSGSGPW